MGGVIEPKPMWAMLGHRVRLADGAEGVVVTAYPRGEPWLAAYRVAIDGETGTRVVFPHELTETGERVPILEVERLLAERYHQQEAAR